MSKHLGDYDQSAVIYGKFSTYQPSTGATFTLAGSPAIAVYKDASTTESSSGVTLTTNFDSRTGLNHVAIDTSSDGSFYSAGSFFDAVLTSGTVDSVSVAGSAIASFTLRKDSSLKPATAGRTLVVDAAGLGDANTVKIGPTGSGTSQTARDIGASVLLSSGTGSGQVSLSSGRPAIQSNTVKNVGLNNFEFVMVNSTTGIPQTGLTVAATRSIDGGSVASCANAVAEVSSGIYKIDLATSDLNGNVITLRFTATGAADRLITVITTP
jgi:hypothetical protein